MQIRVMKKNVPFHQYQQFIKTHKMYIIVLIFLDVLNYISGTHFEKNHFTVAA